MYSEYSIELHVLSFFNTKWNVFNID